MTHPRFPPTVVLIEDDDVDAMAVERSFRGRLPDLRIVRATNGLDGLAAIRRVREECGGRFVVILDLNMPRMTGIELLAALREDRSLASTIAFVLTTSQDSRDLEVAYGYNVAGYMVKEIDGVPTNDVATLVATYFNMVSFPPAGI